MMTLQQITDWCYNHVTQKAKHDVYDTAKTEVHNVRYENGDLYEYKCDFSGYFRKHVQIRINGDLVYEKNFRD